MDYYVYLLECSDGLLYIGVTNDLSRRMREHQEGFNSGCFTYSRRPVSLKYYLVFDDINEAIFIEKKLKKWSRAKKEAFFQRDWEALHKHAKCKNSTSHVNK
jgi:putative endonuclease